MAEIPWSTVLSVVGGLYVAGAAGFIVLENRSPQSTFAWLFLFIVFPLGGLLIYVLFGRGWKAFSRRKELLGLLRGTSFASWAARMIERQQGALEELAGHGRAAEGRLGSMLWTSGRAPLTFGNRVEVLQNASEKYPRLLEDVRQAGRSVHMVYYEWASDRFTDDLLDLLAEKVGGASA